MIAISTYCALNYESGTILSILHIFSHLILIIIIYSITISILQTNKIRHRVVVQRQTASKWLNKNLYSNHWFQSAPSLLCSLQSCLNGNGILYIHCAVFWFAKHYRIFTDTLKARQGYSTARRRETREVTYLFKDMSKSEKSGIPNPHFVLFSVTPCYKDLLYTSHQDNLECLNIPSIGHLLF